MVALLPKPRARKILSLIEHEKEKGCPARLKNKAAVCCATSGGGHFAPRVTVISL